MHIAILVCIYGILGVSLNLATGETGLLSVMHAAFYGFGAYAAALLMLTFGMHFFVALLIAVILTGTVALVVGLAFARLKEVHYVFGTVSFSIIALSIFHNWQSLTNGPLGLAGIPRPTFFGISFLDSTLFLLLSLVLLAIVYGVSSFVVGSSFGRVLHALREDEEALSVFGYRTTDYKLAVLLLSGSLAGVAGALFASYITFIDPTGFTLNESIFILAIIILGGLGSARGAILGAVLLVTLPEALRFVGFPSDIAAHLRLLTYGIVLILFMLYRPHGLLGRFRM